MNRQHTRQSRIQDAITYAYGAGTAGIVAAGHWLLPITWGRAVTYTVVGSLGWATYSLIQARRIGGAR